MRKEGRCRLPAPFEDVSLSYSVGIGSWVYIYFTYRGKVDQLIRSGAIETQMAWKNLARRRRADSHGDSYTARTLPRGRIEVCRHLTSTARAMLLPGVSDELRAALKKKERSETLAQTWENLDDAGRGLLERLIYALASAHQHGDQLTCELFMRMSRAGRNTEAILRALETRVAAYDKDLLSRSSA